MMSFSSSTSSTSSTFASSDSDDSWGDFCESDDETSTLTWFHVASIKRDDFNPCPIAAFPDNGNVIHTDFVFTNAIWTLKKDLSKWELVTRFSEQTDLFALFPGGRVQVSSVSIVLTWKPDEVTKFWEKEKKIFSIGPDGSSNALAMTCWNDKRFAVLSNTNVISECWTDGSKGSKWQSCEIGTGHWPFVRTICAHPSGKLILGSKSGRVTALHKQDATKWITLRTHGQNSHTSEVTAIDILATGRVVSGAMDKQVCIWTLSNYGLTIETVLTSTWPIHGLKTIPDGSFLTAQCGNLQLWQLRDESVWDAETLVRRVNGDKSFTVRPDGLVVYLHASGFYDRESSECRCVVNAVSFRPFVALYVLGSIGIYLA